MSLATLFVAALLAQEPTPGPSIERSDTALTLHLGDGVVVDYGLGPVGVRGVDLRAVRA